MLTPRDIFLAVLLPAAVAGALAGVGSWRRWRWAMPVAAGAGFLAGYIALTGVPSLPPRDGMDWLFWAAIPATAFGVLDSIIGRSWGWVLGTAAGAATWLIVRPLVPQAVPAATMWGAALALAAVGAAVCLAIRFVEPRLTSPAVVAALCVTTGAAAVTIMSSNLRTGGTYGMAAAAALGPVACLIGRTRGAARGVAVVAVPILAGLLVGGHFYPDPGLTWLQAAVLMAAPALLVPAAAIPGKRNWLRGVAGALAVAVAVAAVAVPAAHTAMKAAEPGPADPYAGYYK